MTWEELEEVRGWQAGLRGQPYDEHQTDNWKRGYELGASQRREKEKRHGRHSDLMHPCRYGLGRNCFDQGLEKLLMDVSFEVILKDPVPHKVRGIAEVAGDPKGRWEVRDIWIATHPFGYRLAGYDERQNIRLALHMLAGGDIGRSYRGSLKIT